MKKEAIILHRLMRIGDSVQMNMDPEARSWGRKGVPDGTLGVVIGFHRYESYTARIGNWGRAPGRYSANGGVIVSWIDGTTDMPTAHDLYWAGDVNREEREKDKAWNNAFCTDQFLGPLPDLPFWEHDLVRDKSGIVQWVGQDEPISRICNIQYHNIGQKRNDGSPMPIYNLESPAGRSGYTWTQDENLELVERGNLWKWYNDKASILWKDLHEEASMHKLLGLYQEVRNPTSGYYSWDEQELLPALHEGLIDVVSVSGGLFGSGPSTRCCKFHDRDLGERVRAECIKGFSKTPA